MAHTLSTKEIPKGIPFAEIFFYNRVVKFTSVAEQKFVIDYTRHPQHFKQLGFEPNNRSRTYAQLH